MVVFEEVKKEQLSPLLSQDFGVENTKTQYEVLRLRSSGAVLVLYASGKLVLQGKQADKVAERLEKLGLQKVKEIHFRRESGWIIGSDEALKGDTFGGVVVAAVKADDTLREHLVQLGVADSKKLPDAHITVLAEQIKKVAACEVRSLLPEEYNKHHGQTKLLNQLHHASAQYLQPGRHVVDKYPGCTVGDIQEEKAESKYIEVAAASILARAAAVQQFHFLSVQAGFEVPKGSTHVQEALEEMKKRMLDPKKFVKLHFRNVSIFLGKNPGTL
jgi:ribonuclease HIII